MNYSPPGRVGLSGPERANANDWQFPIDVANEPSPAAKTSDPPRREGDDLLTIGHQCVREMTFDFVAFFDFYYTRDR